jgi:hypothetical protein
MDEKRIARLFGLTLGGLFAISLILSAITIESGMIPSAALLTRTAVTSLLAEET